VKSLDIVLNKHVHCTRKLLCYSFVTSTKVIGAIACRRNNVGTLRTVILVASVTGLESQAATCAVPINNHM